MSARSEPMSMARSSVSATYTTPSTRMKHGDGSDELDAELDVAAAQSDHSRWSTDRAGSAAWGRQHRRDSDRNASDTRNGIVGGKVEEGIALGLCAEAQEAADPLRCNRRRQGASSGRPRPWRCTFATWPWRHLCIDEGSLDVALQGIEYQRKR